MKKVLLVTIVGLFGLQLSCGVESSTLSNDISHPVSLANKEVKEIAKLVLVKAEQKTLTQQVYAAINAVDAESYAAAMKANDLAARSEIEYRVLRKVMIAEKGDGVDVLVLVRKMLKDYKKIGIEISIIRINTMFKDIEKDQLQLKAADMLNSFGYQGTYDLEYQEYRRSVKIPMSYDSFLKYQKHTQNK